MICETVITYLKVLRGDERACENQAAGATRVDTDPKRTQLERQVTSTKKISGLTLRKHHQHFCECRSLIWVVNI